jgi:hypothetical protein
MTLDTINERLVTLIHAGALVHAIYPVHSALEQQFRDAVGTGTSAGEES